MSNQQKNGNIIAIVTMMFLYAMIAFVTNLAAPIGVVMKNDPEVGGSNMLAMLGNFMNFFAYLFMGIPAGKMLTRIGYKKTAMLGILVGFIGVTVQWISGFEALEGYQDNAIYLLGAFVSGLSVCLLNTVVNPMLNLLGGGGNRGNQLNLMGGTLNSLSGTLTLWKSISCCILQWQYLPEHSLHWHLFLFRIQRLAGLLQRRSLSILPGSSVIVCLVLLLSSYMLVWKLEFPEH